MPSSGPSSLCSRCFKVAHATLIRRVAEVRRQVRNKCYFLRFKFYLLCLVGCPWLDNNVTTPMSISHWRSRWRRVSGVLSEAFHKSVARFGS